MSGNLTVVREMSGILLKVRKKIVSGKSCLKLFIVNCIFVSVQVFSTSTGQSHIFERVVPTGPITIFQLLIGLIQSRDNRGRHV